MNAPCPTCPWRRSSTVGGADIPRFNLDKMRGLACTVGPPGQMDFRTIFACHHSPEGAEQACVGYVHVQGWDTNLAVRFMARDGRIDIQAIDAACQGLDLWPSFAAMLEAYEQAQNRQAPGDG